MSIAKETYDQLEQKYIDIQNSLDETQLLTGVGSWEWNPKTDEVRWSKMMFLLLGLDENHDQPSYELALKHVHNDDKDHYERVIKKSVEGNTNYYLKNRITCEDGSILSVISRGRCYNDSDGNLIRMIGTIEDVSKQKEENEEKEKRAAELAIIKDDLAILKEKEILAVKLSVANKKLLFQNDEKEKRAAELVIIKDDLAILKEKEILAIKLSVANKELEQFVHLASHDLQEPLRTISNYLEVFEEDYSGVLDDRARKYLDSVKMASARMRLRINSLLEYSSLGQNIDFVSVDCKELIDTVIADLDGMIKASSAIIEVSEMPTLNLYEVEMRVLFQNLISNAIKFQKKENRPKIQIRAEEINNGWEFSISDNGIGITPVHFERIFEIFQSLNSKAEYEGTGIGLAHCKKIVQLHLGKIRVESTLGQGTTFYFSIQNLTL